MQVSKGRFLNGKLIAEDGCSDAHIAVNKFLSDGKVLEIHFYGQTKQSDTKSPLKFLESNIFSKDYYFHSETYRSRFQRVAQVHVIGEQVGRKGGYEIVGNWGFNEKQQYEMRDIMRNDFQMEIKSLVNSLREEIKKSVLKCEDDSRYSILGFYLKIAGNQTTLEELTNRILSEKDEKICTKTIKNIADKLNNCIKIQNEIKYYLYVDKDLETSAEIKAQIEEFLKEKYLNWLQSYNKCDSIPSDISFINLLLLDPNILKMMLNVRELISRYWSLNVSFDITQTYTNSLEDAQFVTNFQNSWRSYYKSTEKLKKLMKIEGNFYKNGWFDYEQRTYQIKRACDQYIDCLKYLIEILIRKRNSKSLNKEDLKSSFDVFYKLYSRLFTYELHLSSSGEIVDYQDKSKVLIENIMSNKEIMGNITLDAHMKQLKETISINFLLNAIEYLFNADELLHKIENDSKKIINDLIQKQMLFLINLQNNSIEVDRVMHLFISYLSIYIENIQKWDKLLKFESLEISLSQIKRNILACNEFSLEVCDIDKSICVSICDLIEEKNNLLSNIQYLPLYVKKSSLFSSRDKHDIIKVNEENLLSYLKENNSVKHYSYDILGQSLEILGRLIYRYKNISVKQTIKVCEKYFDIVGEMVKQFDHQQYANDLENFSKQKLAFFEYCDKLSDLNELIEYLDALKKYIVATVDKNEFPIEVVIEEFSKLNKNNTSDLLSLFKVFELNYQNNRSRFIQKQIHLDTIRNDVKLVAKSKKILDQDALKENILKLLADLALISTLIESKMVNKSDGSYKEGSGIIELKPDIVQIIGCICVFGLHKQLERGSVKSILTSIPRQLIEVLDYQGKSLQVSLISMIYAILDYEVNILCNNPYLPSIDETKLFGNFCVMEEELKNIRVLTLNDFVREEIEGDYNYNEQAKQLVEQIILNGEYDANYGVSEKIKEIRNDALSKKRLFIINEVDTLVSSRLEEKFSQTKLIKNCELAMGVELLYEAAKQLAKKNKLNKPNAFDRFSIAIKQINTIEKFQAITRQNKEISNFIQKQSDLFNDYVNELWKCALKVAQFYSANIDNRENGIKELKAYLNDDDEPLFRLSKDGAYCEFYSNNTWSPNQLPEYLNAFFYLELFSKQSNFVEKNPNAYGYMKLKCVSVYHSSVLLDHKNDLIIGITGSLRNRKNSAKNELYLSNAELEILSKDLLNIKEENFIYLPILYDQNRVKFTEFSLLESKSEWIEYIVRTCHELADDGKTCLVYFNSEIDLKQVFERLLKREPFVLTNNEISINHNGEKKALLGELFKKNELELHDWTKSIKTLTTEHYAGQPGKITLIMNDYARDVDIECNAIVAKNGGLHIIQTWFHEDPKHEVNIWNRSARNGASAVYIQIFNLKDIKEIFRLNSKISNKISLDITYSQLRSFASSLLQVKYFSLQKAIRKNKEQSDHVLSWLSQARFDRAQKLERKINTDIDVKVMNDYYKLIINS